MNNIHGSFHWWAPNCQEYRLAISVLCGLSSCHHVPREDCLPLPHGCTPVLSILTTTATSAPPQLHHHSHHRARASLLLLLDPRCSSANKVLTSFSRQITPTPSSQKIWKKVLQTIAGSPLRLYLSILISSNVFISGTPAQEHETLVVH